MPRVGFEPTIPVLEPANTVHGIDRAAHHVSGSTEIGLNVQYLKKAKEA
jgi:hypothetical protein